MDFRNLRLADAGDAITSAINLCLLWITNYWNCLSTIRCGLVAFILNYAAYFAEIFRGGFQSVSVGQYEAAKVLRLNYWQTVRKIIIPQVVKIVIPSIGNEVINLVKDSSLVYVIGLGDLLRAGNVATSRDVTLIPLLLVGLIYLILVGICTLVLRQVEKRYSYFK